MSKILLLGDCHGNFQDVIQLQLESIKANLGVDLCIQCGDFGFYDRCFGTFDKMNINKFPIKTLVIGGNHDDWDFIKSSDTKEWEEKYNLFYKSRGTVEVIDGSVIAFLGGALNVDRRQEGSIDKRTTNYILDVEVNEAVEVFLKHPVIDLMVTHSCPHSCGVGMVGSPYFFESIEKYCHDKGHSTGRNDDCGDGALSRIYRPLIREGIKISNWIYGHFHQLHFKKVDETYFYCIGCSDSSDGKHEKKPFIYDTQTKRIEWLDKVSLLNSNGFHKTRLHSKDPRDNIQFGHFDKL